MGLFEQSENYLRCYHSKMQYSCANEHSYEHTCTFTTTRNYTCGLSICDECSPLTQYKMMKRYMPRMRKYKPFLKHLVLTYGRVSLDSLDEMQSAYKKARKFINANYSGGVVVPEFNYKVDTDNYYLHFHAVVVGSYIPVEDLSSRWGVALGKDDRFVSIMKINADETDESHGNRAIQYISKYIGKGASYFEKFKSSEVTFLSDTEVSIKNKIYTVYSMRSFISDGVLKYSFQFISDKVKAHKVALFLRDTMKMRKVVSVGCMYRTKGLPKEEKKECLCPVCQAKLIYTGINHVDIVDLMVVHCMPDGVPVT